MARRSRRQHNRRRSRKKLAYRRHPPPHDSLCRRQCWLSFKLYTVAADATKTETPLKNYLNKDGSLNDVALVDAFPHGGATAGLIAGDFKDSSGKDVLIPGDAVTASGSGLDPHISPANAEFQVSRVAAARHMDADKVREVVKQYTDGRDLGFLGDPGVNVLRVNIALDNKYPIPGGK